MPRSIKWRQKCPALVTEKIRTANEARLYLLRQTGPTGFLLKEDSSSVKHKVFLGDPHSCTCGDFNQSKELCLHILWVLLKKFRVSDDDPVVFQLCLVEREIQNVIKGYHSKLPVPSRSDNKAAPVSNSNKCLPQKIPDKDDVCSICQDPLGCKRQPLTYCKFGCGNSIHTKCMKVYAEHQHSNGETTVKCPLCRSEFGPYHVVNKDFIAQLKKRNIMKSKIHTGLKCRLCSILPIEGVCYRCTSCTDFFACGNCFPTMKHPNHKFEKKEMVSQRWKPAVLCDDNLPVAMVCGLLASNRISQDTCSGHSPISPGAFNVSRRPSRLPSGQRPPPSNSHCRDMSVVGSAQEQAEKETAFIPKATRSAPSRKQPFLPPLTNNLERSQSLKKLSRHCSVILDGLINVNGTTVMQNSDGWRRHSSALPPLTFSQRKVPRNHHQSGTRSNDDEVPDLSSVIMIGNALTKGADIDSDG